jgi:hypothetical protein
MRLFKAKSIYVYASCVYALNALFLLWHSARGPAPINKTPPLLSVVAPQMVGMAFLAIVAFSYIRNTSSAIKKAVLFLTCLICVLFLHGSLSKFGFVGASIPAAYPVFMTASCAAAILAVWRTVQIMRNAHRPQ